MFYTMLDWIYIFVITFCIGLLLFGIMSHTLKCEIKHSITADVVCGIVGTTVYAQFFSLFYKVGLVANLVLIVVCVITAVIYRSIIFEYLKKIKPIICSWEGIFYLGIILVFAFATSRGTIHTDTSMYHAQAIRWYEEYGVVKGLANLQWHFAYNSSYFGFAALFSMGFLSVGPFHCTTGFIAVVLCIWAFYNLLDVFKHEKHITDACCVAIIIYALVNYAGFVSPASDYAVNFIVLYLVARWAQEFESGKGDVVTYSLLSVLAVYICTLKLSCGLVVLIAIYPAVLLIKGKRVKEIIIFVLCGVITLAPFLARNVIISGWLIYPFPTIDLFDVDWKLPKQYATIDSNTIKVWARTLYDTSLIDMPIREWLPIWWGNLENYEQNLLVCNVIGVILEIIVLVKKLVSKREKISSEIVILSVTCVACTIAWFLTAPFIRYSLAFLLATPVLAVGIYLNSLAEMGKLARVNLYKLIAGMAIVYMFFMSLSYLDHYFMDDMVFVKQNLTEPYYIRQKPYETSEMTEYDMDGVTIYAPTEGEKTGYQYFPSTAYSYMIDLTELRGTELKDGFRNTEYK
jgi:hypothetical protein